MAEPSSQSRRGESWVFWWRLNFSLAGIVLSHKIWPPQLKCLLEDLSCPQQYHRQERGQTAEELPVPEERVQLHPGVEAEQQERTKSCKTSKTAVRGCPQHTEINGQGWAGWPHRVRQTCSKAQNTFSAGWRSLCIQWLPPRLLLPHSNPEETSPAQGVSKEGWRVCCQWEISLSLTLVFFGR